MAVVDAAGVVVARARVPETPEGVKDVLRLLSGLSHSHSHSRKRVPIAIETHQGLLVAALRAAGQNVIAINPVIVARHRGLHSPTRKKSDKQDAALLAEILRKEADRHRPIPSHSDPLRALSVLSIAQWRGVYQRQTYVNALRSQLRLYFPAALQAWSQMPGGLQRPEARAVLTLAPTPVLAARLTLRQLRETLAAAGRRRLLDDQAARLHTLFRAKALRQARIMEDAMGTQAMATLSVLNQICATVDDLTETLHTAFTMHEHAPLYLSFPGVGPLVGARLLADIGDDPNRFDSARSLRAYAGAAPLTWASGGARSVRRRTIANQRLMAIGHVWAFATLTASPGCRQHYDRRRQAGDRHAAALRNLYGRLLGCLHYCLATGQPYDETAAFPDDGRS